MIDKNYENNINKLKNCNDALLNSSKKPLNLAKIKKAIAFAKQKHKNQFRKITNEPYINHPLEVMRILIENRADEDTIIAGILHDTIEDTDTSKEEIENIFGKKIANTVQIESEIKSLPYKERKAEHMKRVGLSSYNTKLVNCADKVSNIKSLLANYEKYGEAIWKYFKGTKEDYYWYYSLALNALKEVSDKKVYLDFCKLFKQLFNTKICYVNLLSNKEINTLFHKIVPENDINWFNVCEISRHSNYVEIIARSICDYSITLKLYNNKAVVSTNSAKIIEKNYLKEMYKLFKNAFKNDYLNKVEKTLF